jgi:hypothetical protein
VMLDRVRLDLHRLGDRRGAGHSVSQEAQDLGLTRSKPRYGAVDGAFHADARPQGNTAPRTSFGPRGTLAP